jgi:UDP-glucose 4-epimerase
MKKILVTGGAGYIGSHTVVELIQSGYEPVVIDNFIYSDGSLIEGIEKITGKKVSFHKGDCRDKDFVTNIFKTQGPIDGVIHFAALKSVKESVQKPIEYYQNNIDSLLTLLEIMPGFNCHNFIFSSSCTVYGQPDHIPVDETAPFKSAESPYGATKQMCERILEDAHHLGFKVASLRYFNPIGAHPSALIGEMSFGGPPNYLVPYIMETLAGIREKLIVFGDDYDTPDGTCIRDYIHVVDIAKAHVKALAYLDSQSSPAMFNAFNLGTGMGASVLELIKSTIKVTRREFRYEFGPRRPGDVVKVYANPKNANTILGWKATLSMEDGLLHAWRWQEEMLKKSRSKN